MDRFANLAPGLEAPARSAVQLAPDDAAALVQITRAVYVGQAGTLQVEMADGMQATFHGVTGGTLLPIRIRKVLTAQTTAGAILGLW